MKAMWVVLVVCLAACGGKTPARGMDGSPDTVAVDTVDAGTVLVVDAAPDTKPRLDATDIMAMPEVSDAVDALPQKDMLDTLDTTPVHDLTETSNTLPQPDMFDAGDVDAPCVANCDGKECGDDGCGGSCGVCEGLVSDCVSGVECLEGACTTIVKEGFCFIEGICVPNGTICSSKSCNACQSQVSSTHWSEIADWADCYLEDLESDGVPIPGRCWDGVCLYHPWLEDLVCLAYECGVIFDQDCGPCPDPNEACINWQCVCQGGCCGSDIDCEDWNPCTLNSCDEEGICKTSVDWNTPGCCQEHEDCGPDGLWDDENPATLDYCAYSQCVHVTNACQHECNLYGGEPPCSDGNPCTIDYCDGFECALDPWQCVGGCDCTHEWTENCCTEHWHCGQFTTDQNYHCVLDGDFGTCVLMALPDC